jgi:hypothetical protein
VIFESGPIRWFGIAMFTVFAALLAARAFAPKSLTELPRADHVTLPSD